MIWSLEYIVLCFLAIYVLLEMHQHIKEKLIDRSIEAEGMM